MPEGGTPSVRMLEPDHRVGRWCTVALREVVDGVKIATSRQAFKALVMGRS